MWGSSECWIGSEVIADPTLYAEGEEYLQRVLELDAEREEISRGVSDALNFKAFLTINQIANISLTEWLGATNWTQQHGYSDTIKAALLYEVEQILQERDRRNRDAEQKHKLDQLKAAPNGVDMPFQMGGIQGYMK